MQPEQPENNVNPTVPQTEQTVKTDNSKKMLTIAFAAIGALLLLAIILVALLLGKKDSTTSETPSGSNAQDSTSQTSSSSNKKSNKKIVATKSFKEGKLELQVYEPVQSPNYTTINFGVKNTCAGCNDTVYSSDATSYFNSRSNSFLVDDSAGKKYNTVKDADGTVLATPSCSEWLEKNEIMECFVSFSKVPSGSTISWVYGNNRIDGIKIP